LQKRLIIRGKEKIKQWKNRAGSILSWDKGESDNIEGLKNRAVDWVERKKEQGRSHQRDSRKTKHRTRTARRELRNRILTTGMVKTTKRIHT